MAVVYDTTGALIPAIQRRVFMPSSQATYATSDLLAILNAEMQSALVPFVMSTREEYFVASTDLAVTAGTATYDIPSGAIGGDLRDVLMVATSDSTTRNLVRVEPEQVVGLPTTTGTPVSFILLDEQLTLFPTPSATTESLRLSFHRRPNSLVATASCGTVESASAGTTITCSADVSALFSNGSVVDVVSGTPQFRTKASGLAVQSVATTAVTVDTAANVSAGDFLCLSGESPVAQLPLELHPLLVLRASAVIAEAQGPDSLLQSIRGELQEKERLALVLLANRVKGQSRKMPNGMRSWRGAWGVAWEG